MTPPWQRSQNPLVSQTLSVVEQQFAYTELHRERIPTTVAEIVECIILSRISQNRFGSILGPTEIMRQKEAIVVAVEQLRHAWPTIEETESVLQNLPSVSEVFAQSKRSQK